MTHPLTGRPYLVGYFDKETTETLLLLVDVDSDQLDVWSWNAQQLREAGDWALRTHLRASDNVTVPVPPRPAHVPDCRPLNPDAKTVMEL